MRILGDYRDDLVLVGGWILYLLVPTRSMGICIGHGRTG